MADDAARIAQLEVELQYVRERHSAEVAALVAERDEGLEQQAALTDILQRMVAAPGDTDTILGVIASHAARIGRAADAEILRRQGDQVYYAAHHGPLELPNTLLASWPLRDRRISNDVILNGRTIHAPDISVEGARYPDSQANFRRAGIVSGPRTWLGVPLHIGTQTIGALVLRRPTVAPFSDHEIAVVEGFAAEAALAIENARLFEELEQRNAELQESNRQVTESLEQQTATAEVLRIIAASPNRLQSVLDALVASARRLTGADEAVVARLDGTDLVFIATTRPVRIGDRHTAEGSVTGTALRERRTIHVYGSPEEQRRQYPESRAIENGVCAQVITPLLRQGTPIGTLGVFRREARPFTDDELALLETFADQAVIAIENARLFEELEQRTTDLGQSLEQQTALAEVMRAIAASPTSLAPVLDAVTRSAARLCPVDSIAIWHLDGDEIEHVAGLRADGESPLTGTRVPLRRGSLTGRAILDREAIRVDDVALEFDGQFPDAARIRSADPHAPLGRSMVAIPLRHEEAAVGGLVAIRHDVRPFSTDEIRLLEAFADQAAIAITNTRLFQELEQRTSDLTQALEQQTATAEILRVIATAPSDLQAVTNALAANAARLCDSDEVAIERLEGEHFRILSRFGTQETVGTLIPADQRSVAGRAVLERRTVHVHDRQAEEVSGAAQERVERFGWRTVLATPILRDGVPIGTIVIFRREVRPFTEQQIALLETFADQAVIAIENARLFSELQESNRRVSEALEQQTATAEVLGVIAASPNDLTRVLQVIVDTATRLTESDGAGLQQERDGHLKPIVESGHTVAASAASRAAGYPGPVVTRESMSGRAFLGPPHDPRA